MNISINELYAIFFDDALNLIKDNFCNWTKYSIQPQTLVTLLNNSGLLFMSKMAELLDVFAANVQHEKDFELQESMLILLVNLFKKLDASFAQTDFIEPFIQKIVLKSCIWRAGRNVAKLRTLGIHLFYQITNLYNGNQEFNIILVKMFNSDIIPVILSNLDDDELSTRKDCLKIVGFLLDNNYFGSINWLTKLKRLKNYIWNF
jgi:dynein assembly factor 5, axonemal